VKSGSYLKASRHHDIEWLEHPMWREDMPRARTWPLKTKIFALACVLMLIAGALAGLGWTN
jgi:hypothetical protein